MNRTRLIFAGLILLAAIVLGVLRSLQMAQVPDAVVVASMTEPGCDAPGQLWLELTNLADRPLLRASGTLSYGRQDVDPVPMGNFAIEGPVLPGLGRGTCVSVDESRRPEGDRAAGWWLAWVTTTELGEPSGNPDNPADQGFLRGASR